MTEKSPAFQFYPKDMLADPVAMGFGNELLGAYLKLLCFDWMENGLPDDDAVLIELVNLKPLALEKTDNRLERIRSKFIEHPTKKGVITNKRLQKEREKQAEHRDRSSRGGKQSAKQRASKAQPEGQAKGNTSSPSPSPSSSSKIKKTLSDKEPVAPNSRENFELAWDAYPEKKGKEKAFRHFTAQIVTEQDYKNLGIAMVSYIQDVAYQRNNGHPDLMWKHGATFFNQHWKDYIDYQPPPKKTADGIPAERDLKKDELKARIWNEIEFVKGEVLEGKFNFGDLMASTWLWMAVGKSIVEFEQRFAEDPLDKERRQFYDDLVAEYKMQDDLIEGTG